MFLVAGASFLVVRLVAAGADSPSGYIQGFPFVQNKERRTKNQERF
jgi:hypothetical protein